MSYKISPQLKELYKEWLEYLKIERQYSNHTIISYNTDITFFLEFLNTYFATIIDLKILQNIKAIDIRSWLASRSDFKNSSSRRALSAVKSFFKFLKKFNYLNNVIIDNIRSPKKNINLPRALSSEDSIESLNSIDSISDEAWIGARDKAILSLIYGCGLRISEVLNITNKDINEDYITIYGKGKKERILPIIEQVKFALDNYLNICPYNFNKNDAIFIGKQGKKLNPAVFQRQIRRLRVMLAISETATPHAFRHSFASDILANGADLRSIQELLGHESLSTTQRYTKINPTQLLEIYKKAHPKSKN